MGDLRTQSDFFSLFFQLEENGHVMLDRMPASVVTCVVQRGSESTGGRRCLTAKHGHSAVSLHGEGIV